MRRALRVGVVIGIVAFVASGAASFWLTSSLIAVPDAPRRCSNIGTIRCFGSVAVDDMVMPLRARGFVCDDVIIYCDLFVGGGVYRVTLLRIDDSVYDYSVEARFDLAMGPSPRALDLLSWFAALPFRHDPATASAARAWTLQRVRSRVHALALINGYGYEVEGNGDQAGASLYECPSGTGCAVLFHGYLRLRVRSASG
jgi:hypothetical protein